MEQTIELLLAGRVDATLNAEVTFYDYMNVHPEAKLKVTARTDEASIRPWLTGLGLITQ